jgi:hypothetical protein
MKFHPHLASPVKGEGFYIGIYGEDYNQKL